MSRTTAENGRKRTEDEISAEDHISCCAQGRVSDLLDDEKGDLLGRTMKEHFVFAVAEAGKPMGGGAGSAPVYPAEVWLILSPAKSRAEDTQPRQGGAGETGLCLCSA